jgi:hypothetical protein
MQTIQKAHAKKEALRHVFNELYPAGLEKTCSVAVFKQNERRKNTFKKHTHANTNTALQTKEIQVALGKKR